MNHELIMSLLEIYNKGPEGDSELAVRRLAVLLDREMAEMEKNGIAITRDSLLKQIEETLKKYPKQKAS